MALPLALMPRTESQDLAFALIRRVGAGVLDGRVNQTIGSAVNSLLWSTGFPRYNGEWGAAWQWVYDHVPPPLQDQAVLALESPKGGISEWLISAVSFAAVKEAKRHSSSVVWLSDVYSGVNSTPFLRDMFPEITRMPSQEYGIVLSGQGEGQFTTGDDDLFAGIYCLWTVPLLATLPVAQWDSAINTQPSPILPWEPRQEGTYLRHGRNGFARYLTETVGQENRRYYALIIATEPTYQVSFDSETFVQGMATFCQWFGLDLNQIAEIYDNTTGERLLVQ